MEIRRQECDGRLLSGWAEFDRCRFLVAARSSSVCYPHTLDYAALAREFRRHGCTHVISSAVCGSLDPHISVPSIMILDQFIDMHRIAAADTPPAEEEIRFEDFSYPYCPELRSRAGAYLGGQGPWPVALTGCYVGKDGPRSETAAEVRAYRILGGDVVGMTAVREAIAYRHAGLCMATIALVTHHGAGLGGGPVSSADIQQNAAKFADLLLECSRDVLTQSTSFGCEC